MSMMSVYRKIEHCLIDAYKLNPHDTDLSNQIKCRSIKLTQLYFLVSWRAENSLIGISNKYALTELLYTANNQLTADPLSLPLPLVLHVLEDDLYSTEQELDAQFSEVAQSMREWFVDYRERRHKSPSCYSDLPELHWRDLPHELFDLMPKN